MEWSRTPVRSTSRFIYRRLLTVLGQVRHGSLTSAINRGKALDQLRTQADRDRGSHPVRERTVWRSHEGRGRDSGFRNPSTISDFLESNSTTAPGGIGPVRGFGPRPAQPLPGRPNALFRDYTPLPEKHLESCRPAKKERTSFVRRAAADSQFLYGSHVVEAALRARRRTFHTLYLGKPRQEQLQGRDAYLEELAASVALEVKHLAHGEFWQLDKMALSNAHNGVVLEVSPLPTWPTLCLEPMKRPKEALRAVIDLPPRLHQPAQKDPPRQVVPRGHYAYSLSAEHKRFPLVLLISGVMDPANLGSIFRSAAYFGVDALAISDHHTATVSPTVSKVAAGAAEYMPILSVADTARFVTHSKANGWRFYAAVPPWSRREKPPSWRAPEKFARVDSLSDRLRSEPTVLVYGSEAKGIPTSVLAEMDHLVSLAGEPSRPRLLDSLNVAVAAAMIIRGFLPNDGSAAERTESASAKEEGSARLW